jgi:alkylhydroperoxidase family enzyme
MAWIRTYTDDEAKGPLKEQFDAAIRRAGRVYNIVRLMSQSAPTLAASMGLYRAIMFGPSPLSRGQRELIATRVSALNRCEY